MLRIAITPVQAKPSPVEEKPKEEQVTGEGQDSPTEIDDDEVGLPKLEQAATGYLGPEHGPFECEHCIYFEQPRACHIVSGDIDPHGCCNLFVANPHAREEEASEEAPDKEMN